MGFSTTVLRILGGRGRLGVEGVDFSPRRSSIKCLSLLSRYIPVLLFSIGPVPLHHSDSRISTEGEHLGESSTVKTQTSTSKEDRPRGEEDPRSHVSDRTLKRGLGVLYFRSDQGYRTTGQTTTEFRPNSSPEGSLGQGRLKPLDPDPHQKRERVRGECGDLPPSP